MHEYSIVEQYVESILKQLRDDQVDQVKSIHFRRGSSFSEGALRQAFEMLSENTPLQNAELIIEEFAQENTCANCGYKQTVTADDLVGHMYICPMCGYADQIDETGGLELLKVSV